MVIVIRGIGLVAGTVLAFMLVNPLSLTVTLPTNGQSQGTNGQALYRTHCAGCHGEQGDGNGLAARFLYPRPRDFTAAEFRLVTTTNLLPTEDDLMNVITRGMPGSAMMPFGHLPEGERKALVAYVNELTREGMIRKAANDAKSRGETPDEQELRREITEFLKPVARLEFPKEWPTSDKPSVARGLTLYTANCASCHGPTGRGDGAQDQKDSSGMPIRPRDFSRGIFKGGQQREQLYARIVLGMKGTPMPGNSSLKPEEIGDIVNYIQSLAAADAELKIEHKRKTITARRVNAALPDDLSRIWKTTAAPSIVVSPLWWRDGPDANFEVAAVHDGKTIAIRMTWADATRDEHVNQTDQFEDMAAVQLFRGQPEPFLGMGSEGAMPDLWMWRASWQRPAEERTNYDLYPQLPNFMTAPAAGNPNSHLDPSQTAGNLAAKGAGSVTFRPKASQVVSARASWSNGRWEVTFRRPMNVSSEAGVPLAPGQTASIAFALWDGAVRDRNGQKQVSIWHDLKVE